MRNWFKFCLTCLGIAIALRLPCAVTVVTAQPEPRQSAERKGNYILRGVGETPAVSLAEWRKLGVIPQGWETVEGQPCLVGQTSDGNMVIHVFTVDRKYNIACILVGAPVTQGMIERLKQSAPMNTWEQLYYNDTDGGMWRSSFKRDGYKTQRIIVMSDRWLAITNEAGFDYLSLVWQSPSPDPSFVPKPASDQNDCVIVATEALARLKKTASWAKMAGFMWTENTTEIDGHVVVFFQPTQSTNVFMYDKSGSYDLHTKSHDLNEIAVALNQLLRDSEIRVESPRWLENDDSREEFASSKSNQQPSWSSSRSISTRELGAGVEHENAITRTIIPILCLCAFTVFGVFCRYAGVRLWPIYILSGPVYHALEEVRRRRAQAIKARPRSELRAITALPDDPVERALERVRRNKQ